MYSQQFNHPDLSNHSFLITGGAGFIGSHIAEYLLKYNAGKVRVLDNLLTGNRSNLTQFDDYENFEFIDGDITDLETCREACKGIDYITHQAALGSVPRSIKDPVATNNNNLNGFLNMLVAAKDSGIKRVVYASSSSVYGDSPVLPKVEENIGKPLSPYAVSKYADELYAHVFGNIYGMEIIGLRYFNIFGPRQDPSGQYAAVIPIFVSKLLSGDTVFIDGDGEQTRDFTFVENAVQANVLSFFTQEDAATNRIYNVAVGENYSVNHLYNSICKQLEIEAKPAYRAEREGDIKNSLADISAAKKLLTYQPHLKFSDGLEQTVKYFVNLYQNV